MIKITENKNVAELPSQKKNKINKVENKKKVEKVNLMPEEPKQEREPVIKTVKLPLNGRKGPSFDDDIIEIYSAGTKLEIIGENDGWGKTTAGTYVKLEFVE